MTDGAMGSVPSWYRLLKAARYLGVPPWELATKPMTWVNQAEAAQDAEAHAQAVRNPQGQRPPGV